MPMLPNKRRELFAQSVVSGMSAAEAYRKHWPKASKATAETNGPEVARDTQVKLRISELRELVGRKVDEEFPMTRVEWLKSFARIADKAEDAQDFSAAKGCLREIGLAIKDWYAPEEIGLSINYERPEEAISRAQERGLDVERMVKSVMAGRKG